MVVPKDYDDTLTGSDLVREHFRRGGGGLRCYIDDNSEARALADEEVRTVTGVEVNADFQFETGLSNWRYAVACDDDGAVLTADQLLGGL